MLLPGDAGARKKIVMKRAHSQLTSLTTVVFQTTGFFHSPFPQTCVQVSVSLTKSNMEREDIDKRVATILDGAQDSAGYHARLMKELSTLCDVAGPEKVLRKSLMQALPKVLVVFKREPCVERVVSFLIQFVSQCLYEVQGRPFPVYFMTYLLPFTKASKGSKDTDITKAVRFRSTQLVSGVLNSLSEETELKNAVWAELETHLVERASDKIPLIRIQAALGLSRLQDVEESANAASQTYLRLLSSDPNKEVRRTALNNLVTSRNTLSTILDRVRDSNSDVRGDAFRLLTANVRMKTLTIKQRVFLIQSGLRDRDANVKKECVTMVLEWLKSQNSSVPVLLKAFDVQNTEDKLIESLIETLLEHVSMETIEWRKGVVTPELAVLWRVFVGWNKSRNEDSVVERNLPENLIEFCELITTVVTESQAPGYTLRQILKLAPWMEKTDEGGRRAVLGLLCEISAENFLSEQDVEAVARAIFTFSFGMEDFVSRMKDAIRRSREHLELFEQEENVLLLQRQETRMAELKRLLGPSHLRKMMQKRERDEKIAAGETVEGEWIEEEESVELASRKEELNMLLTLKKNRKMVSEWSWMRTMTLVSQIYAHSLVRDVDVSDSTTATASSNEVAEQLLAFVPLYISVAMSHSSMVVRMAAMKALGGIATLEVKRNAVQHVELLYHALSNDDVEVRAEALKVLFDLVLAAGFEVFTTHPTQKFSPGDLEDDFALPDFPHEYPQHSIFAVLHKYLLDDEVVLQTTAVEGFTKLFAAKRLTCPRTLSELLVLLFNPDTNDNVTLQQSLSLFLPMFAFAQYTNQQLFAEAFLPTLRRFLAAEADSPLAEAHIPTFLKFMLHLTDAAQLNQMHQRNMKPEHAVTLHNRLGIDICTEILIAPGAKHAKALAKFFGYFDVDTQDAQTVRELEMLLQRVQRAVKLDKTTEKVLVDMLDVIARSSAVPMLNDDAEAALNARLDEAMDIAVDSLSGAMKSVEVVNTKVTAASKRAKTTEKPRVMPKSTKKLVSAKSRRGRVICDDSDDSDSDAPLQWSSEDDEVPHMGASSSGSEDEEDIVPARQRNAKRSSSASKRTTAATKNANPAKNVARRLYEEEEEDDNLIDEVLASAPAAKRVMSVKDVSDDSEEEVKLPQVPAAREAVESDSDLDLDISDSDDIPASSASLRASSDRRVVGKKATAAKKASAGAKKFPTAKRASSAVKRSASKSKIAEIDATEEVAVEDVENDATIENQPVSRRTSAKQLVVASAMEVDEAEVAAEAVAEEEAGNSKTRAKRSTSRSSVKSTVAAANLAPKRTGKATASKAAPKASKATEQSRLMKEMSAMLD
jgi:hypothetical protein